MLFTKAVRCSMEIIVILVIISSMLTLTETQAAQRYCGKTLTDIMKLVCRSGFNGKPLKRAIADLDYNSLANEMIHLNISKNVKPSEYSATRYREQFVPTHTLNHLMAKLLNNKRKAMIQTRQRRLSSSGGIYYECCLNKCTTSEMSAYCL